MQKKLKLLKRGAAKSKRLKLAKPSRLLYTKEDIKRRVPIGDEGPGGVEPYRTPWRRDFARIIHSPAFRRQQGKTQLFPGVETDFFRNRLTHSLEVAQIAKSIATRLNSIHPFFNRDGFRIDTDLIEAISLVHDIGHPPFGHNGEHALDECMRQKGGFEGNAQTLRILARLEKRQKLSNSSAIGISHEGVDRRAGLNLCYRTLAGTLKYDTEIPYDRRSNDPLCKGYYRSESQIVKLIKKHVTGRDGFTEKFKTVECYIMDIADDIAYSTYDLEDSFKARFLTPLTMFGAQPSVINEVVKSTGKTLREEYSPARLMKCLDSVFADLFDGEYYEPKELSSSGAGVALFIAHFSGLADKLMSTGYLRAAFTSHLVGEFIGGVEVEPNEEVPALSVAKLAKPVLEKVEVLKHFTFNSLIKSPRLKVAEYRGVEIVTELFEVLSDRDGEGWRLLPEDVQALFSAIRDEEKDRVICDFIAGMTDRYAIEFYGRLKSEQPETIFKPH